MQKDNPRLHAVLGRQQRQGVACFLKKNVDYTIKAATKARIA